MTRTLRTMRLPTRLTMRLLHRITVIVAALGLLGGGLLPSAQADTKLISGVCDLKLDVTRSSDSIDIATQSGACVTSGGTATGELVASLSPKIGPGCSAGTVDGGGGFTIEFNPLESLTWSEIDVNVAFAEPVAEIVFEETTNNSSIVAAGSFVQSPVTDPDCETTEATYTWTGVLAFEDPVLE